MCVFEGWMCNRACVCWKDWWVGVWMGGSDKPNRNFLGRSKSDSRDWPRSSECDKPCSLDS